MSYEQKKELIILIQTANIELNEMLKNGNSKKDFFETSKQKATWELELAQLNMSEYD